MLQAILLVHHWIYKAYYIGKSWDVIVYRNLNYLLYYDSCFFFWLLIFKKYFLFSIRQWNELDSLRRRHVEEIKTYMQILKPESLQSTILYEALSPLTNTGI